MDAVGRVVESDRYEPVRLRYPQAVEDALALLAPAVEPLCTGGIPARWISLKLLADDTQLIEVLGSYQRCNLLANDGVASALQRARALLAGAGVLH